MRLSACTLAAILSLPIGAAARPQTPAADPAGAGPAARAFPLPAAAPIRVDGRLDEPAWQQAEPIGGFTQTDPDQGAPPTERTEVRVMFDASSLYVGVTCHDRTPGAIVSTQLTRDAELDVDDRIRVVLDPFFDHRNGFFFETNPAGARSDGQVSNNAEHTSYDWDGIWLAGTRVTDEGWTAEIAIPFKTLRFKPGQTTWGLNIERSIKRRNETDRWASPRRDVWFTNLAEAGRLEGLVGIRQGRGLDLRPYASAGRVEGDGTADVGFDVSKNVTPNLNTSITVNTDFAETEADSRQVNLTRFPLFYPEKRAFFLEGAGVFDVPGAAGASNDIVPFFSRRIGLYQGEEVPVLAGAKLIGRQGPYNIGFLDVQTRDLSDNPNTGQNLLVGRVARNFWRQSWVGAIVTHGNPAGTGRNTLVGADARLATSSFLGDKNLSLDLFVLRTDDEASGTADYAAGFAVDYPNDLVDAYLSWKQVGDDFEPALGFVPRRGIRKLRTGGEYRPRPGRWGIRQFRFELRPEYIADLRNRVQNWTVETTPFGVEMDSGDEIAVTIEPQYEYLPESFEIADGILVPRGSYQWTRYGINAESASKRPVEVEGSVSWGGFYDGTRRNAEIQIRIKPSAHVAIGLNAERNDVSLPAGSFYTQVVELVADYNFSANVFWANLVQYDTESRVLGVQSRFRWILKPGNDLFFVVNRGWYRELDDRWARAFDKLSGKLAYTFRF